MRIGLVACCKTKRPGACAARDLYCSTLFRRSRAYVEAHCDDWRILSAQHGVVHPLQEIAPYDVTLLKMTPSEREAWGRECRSHLVARFPGATFLCLCGSVYMPATEGLPVALPLLGLGLGKRIAWLEEYKDMPWPFVTHGPAREVPGRDDERRRES